MHHNAIYSSVGEEVTPINTVTTPDMIIGSTDVGFVQER